jgi:hypothetical protein
MTYRHSITGAAIRLAASLFVVLTILAALPCVVSAVDFANLPLGLEAIKIVEQQYKELYPDSKHGYEMECVRGEPSPLFGSKIKSEKSKHYKAISATEALETIVTEDGDALTIFNGGCEYYVIAIRYEFPENAHDKNDSGWWIEKAARALLRADELGADPVFDFKKSAQTIKKAANDIAVVTDIVDMPVEGDGFDFLQTRISITNYGQLPNASGSFIELELFKGPL